MTICMHVHMYMWHHIWRSENNSGRAHQTSQVDIEIPCLNLWRLRLQAGHMHSWPLHGFWRSKFRSTHLLSNKPSFPAPFLLQYTLYCIPGWSWTHYVQRWPWTSNSPAYASEGLGSQLYTSILVYGTGNWTSGFVRARRDGHLAIKLVVNLTSYGIN